MQNDPNIQLCLRGRLNVEAVSAACYGPSAILDESSFLYVNPKKRYDYNECPVDNQ